MEGYAKRVRQAAHEMSGKPIFNSSLEHASVIAENLFRSAEAEVCIFSGKLNAHVYASDGVLESARNFLSTKGNAVRVVVEDLDKIDLKDHQFCKEFGVQVADGRCFSNSHDVHICEISKGLGDLPYHFMVADQKSFRFEPDKSKCAAVAAFGDENTASHLKGIFEILWKTSSHN